MIHLFPFIKMIADTALWLAGSSVVISLFFPVANFMPACILFGICGGIAHYLTLKKENLRFLGVLPGLLALLLCKNLGDYLVVLPAFAYLFLSVMKETLQADQTQMYYRFKGWVLGCLLVSLLCFARHLNWAFLCCILSLACWVFLMRMLRHDLSDFSDKRLVCSELGLLGLVGAMIIALSQDVVLDASLALLKLTYQHILQPLLMLVLTLIMMVFRLFDYILGLFFDGKFEMDLNGMVGQSFEAVQEYFPETAGEGGSSFALLVIQVVCIAVFLTLAFFLFRYLMSGAVKAVAAKESEDGREAITAQEVVNEPVSLLDRSPEARVRRSYAAYCRAVTKYRKKISPCDTTRGVNILAELSENPDAEALRLLYLRARYTKSEPLTAADARAAASLSRSLKNKLEKM